MLTVIRAENQLQRIPFLRTVYDILCIYLENRYRGSYMSAHVLLNSLNELRKNDKMRCFPSISHFFAMSLINSTGIPRIRCVPGKPEVKQGKFIEFTDNSAQNQLGPCQLNPHKTQLMPTRPKFIRQLGPNL